MMQLLIVHMVMVFLLVFSFKIQHSVAAVALEQTVPQSGPVCAGDDVLLTCTVTDATVLIWTDIKTASVYAFTSVADVGAMGSFADFTTILMDKTCVSNTNCQELVSTATITSSGADVEISCKNNFAGADIQTLNVSVSSPPSAPLSPQLLYYTQAMNFSWTPPTDDPLCVTSYTITITNITEENVTYAYKNTSALSETVSVSSLTQGMMYSFSVAGVDGVGRIGEKSTSQLILFDTSQAVTSLQSDVTTDSINISWKPPPQSSRPPATGYKISHNTTGSVLVNQTSDTTFTVEGVAPGVYLFTALAVNILGDGEEESVKVLIGDGVVHSSVADMELRTTSLIGTTCVSSHITSSICIPCETPMDMESDIDRLAVVVPVSVLVSLAVGVVTGSGAMYCITRRRKGCASCKSTLADTGGAGPVYDFPQPAAAAKTQTFELKDNVAYGHVQH